MNDQPFSIVAKGLGKQYQIGAAEQQYDSFREAAMAFFSNPVKKYKSLAGIDQSAERFWALEGVDFQISHGDVVGVIGHNGAGKSTLLKVLSRITPPTEGEVNIYGRVASLLEVGTGFHPELTGRENIYLNGAILGMTRREIEQRFDDIVEFAEVDKFLDTPVKRYSSGMYVRLAFAVAANLGSDVLLVDEVLAVGDQHFQQKCLGKLGDISEQGRTVLFVSHNLSSIAKLCNKVMVLDKGVVTFYGDVKEGIAVYHQQSAEAEVLTENDYTGELYPDVQFTDCLVNGQSVTEGLIIDPFEKVIFSVSGQSEIKLEAYRTVLSIRLDGQLLFSLYDAELGNELNISKFCSTFEISAKLLVPGEYTFSIGGVDMRSRRWLWTRDYRFNISHAWDNDYDTTSSVLGLVNIQKFGSREVDVK